MAPVVTITESELLDALAQAARGAGPEEARTCPELAAATGLSDKRIRAALKALQVQGRLVVHRVLRENLAGASQPVPAYTILPVKKGKRAA